MEIIIVGEESGTVRDAFIAKGHDAMSCDLLPTRKPGPHYQGSFDDVIDYPWDMALIFLPCTHTSVSGAKHFAEKRMDGRQQAAISLLFRAKRKTEHIPKVVFEHPVSILSSKWRKPDQIIQPWMFGHGETKATCLWLKNCPPLEPTNIVEGREQRIWKMAPSETRARDRSETFQGIAYAMAEQWG